MYHFNRRHFLSQTAKVGIPFLLFNGCNIIGLKKPQSDLPAGISLNPSKKGEGLFRYIQRVKGKMDLTMYRQIVGAANEFKEGDQSLGLTAKDHETRMRARQLLKNTPIGAISQHSLYRDDLYDWIQQSTTPNERLNSWTLGELKDFILTESEDAIKSLMPALSSDVIGCLVKLMDNEELIQVGQKVFNPLPDSKIGSKGYMGARIQPNSPTDHIDDIIWQVFNAWSFAVGDLVLGTNPVSSEPASVGKIEAALYDILQTFDLQTTLPNCVLSHIDIQAQVEEMQPGTTGIWFQSLAGTVNANQTFDVTIDKMINHAAKRTGQYGLYFETGQGADFTNGHGEGFDMVIHEARKYGFIRALKQQIAQQNNTQPWVHVNDVAGFIGPEVFKTKEQLVRCCLEDTVMGKLHGLTIGLDICSTLHMDVSLEDLDWCIEQVMPANPAYLMALPTKNDPMLSYLTTSFSDHVRIREKFGYKVDDAMWDFFKSMAIIDDEDKPTKNFGDPIWVYYQYRLRKGDNRSKALIYQEGKKRIQEIRERGVPIAVGYGEHIWDLDPALDQQVHTLYEDAKVSIWKEMDAPFIEGLAGVVFIQSQSKDRKDYIYHPESGEKLTSDGSRQLKSLRQQWKNQIPDVQIILSDGLNFRAISDEGHLNPFLEQLTKSLSEKGYAVSPQQIVIKNGRVRAGYACGELLFGNLPAITSKKGIIHMIGERPGSGHHNFSVYLTATWTKTWNIKGKVDHDITRVVSGISDTALDPVLSCKNGF